MTSIKRTTGGPVDVDIPDLLEKARRRGVKVWTLDRGRLVEVTSADEPTIERPTNE